MTTKEAKEKVLAVWPDASCWAGWGENPCVAIWSGIRGHSERLSTIVTRDAHMAWIDAATRLPASKEVEPAPQDETAEALPVQPNFEEQGKALLAEYAKAWPVQSLPLVEAKEKERCEHCLFFLPNHAPTCFSKVAEPKPTPSTPACHLIDISGHDCTMDTCELEDVPTQPEPNPQWLGVMRKCVDKLDERARKQFPQLGITDSRYEEAWKALELLHGEPREYFPISREPKPSIPDKALKNRCDSESESGRYTMAQELQAWRKWAKGQSNGR